MNFELFISDEAREQLRNLPDEVRRNLGYRLQSLQDDFSGDVKKLKGQTNLYRLRVVIHRLLFRLDGAKIGVYAVKQRKDAYE